MRPIIFLLAILSVSFGTFAHAQLTDDGVTINLFPERPGPYESVTISLSGYSTAISASNIVWTEDGKVASKGIGQTDYTFQTKDVGVQTTIEITITPPNDSASTKRVIITPMGVDLLWEATDSIIPPLYRGKAQPGPESQVKFVALPNMKQANGSYLGSKDVIYTWKQNYKTRAGGGYGKNSIFVAFDNVNPSEVVSVTAESRDKTLGAYKSINLAPENPFIVWYISSPLYGPQFNSALKDGHQVTGSDISLIAMPFFFSPKDTGSSKLSYDWSINGNTVNTPSTPNILFLHRENTDTGGALVNLHLTNTAKLFQETSSELNLELK